jgi:hypothetical protein
MTWKLARATAVACAFVCAAGAAAQTTQSTDGAQHMRDELQAMRARLEALESQQADERAANRRRIGELQQQVADLRGDHIDAQRIEAYAAQVEALRKQLPTGHISMPQVGVASNAGESTNLLNPAITVFIDTGGSISSRGNNKALNRFNLREAELDFRAAIAPFADGVLIIALGEEIESERGGDVSISHEVAIEEGYVDFHTLPWDLALKFGKFRGAFGRNNELHTHDLPQVTRPLAVTKFFGPEGLSSLGAGLSWLVPNPWDKYLETTVQVINADGGPEAPILGGPNAENPAVLFHAKYFDDVGETSSFELGASYLWAHTSRETDFGSHTFGLDAMYQWVDPDPAKFRSLLLQSEFFWTHNDVDRGPWDSFRDHSFGMYTFAQYQLDQNLYTGLRFDYTEFPNSDSRSRNDWDIALSPYLSWYLTEFMRVRGEYQHRVYSRLGDRSSEDVVLLQLTFAFGSHPPHPYWVHR